MTNVTASEQHGCIVCGRIYSLQVTYDSEGLMLSCVATSPGGRVLPVPDQPLIVCSQHSGSDVGAALAEHLARGSEHDHEHDDEA